jgi:predicted PurR-regulated permease PerM
MRESMQRTRWLDALIILLTIIAAAFTAQIVWGLLTQFSDIILYFVLAGLVAFILVPLIQRVDNQPLPSGAVKLAERLFGSQFAQYLERFRVPRFVAVASLYLALALILIAVLAFLIPPVVQQLAQASGPDFAKRISGLAPTLQQMLAAIGLRSSDINTALSGALGSLQTLATLALQTAFAILGAVATLVGNVGLVLLLSFFLTLDGPRLIGKAVDLVPERYHDDIQMLMVTVDRVFGGYIRSTLLQAFLVGVGTAIVMGIFGEPYVLIAGLFAGFFMLIPFVGTALALVPPVLAALSHDPAQALVIFIILLVYQLLVVNVLMPKFLSDALGLHPLVIIASLLIGIKIGGFWGAIFGVPVAGVIATMALFFYRRSKRSDVPSEEERAAARQPAPPSAVASSPETNPANVMPPVGSVRH